MALQLDKETQSLYISLDPQVRKEIEEQIIIAKKSISKQVDKLVNDVGTFATQRPGMTTKSIVDQLDTLQTNEASMWASLKAGVVSDAEFASTFITEDIFFGDLKDEFQITDKSMLMWQAIFVKTCPDCISLHGTSKTRQEWDYFGHPKNAPTVCTTHCKCFLLPVIDPPSYQEMQEPIKIQSKRLRKLEVKRGKKYAPSTFSGKIGQLNSSKNPASIDLRKVKKVNK